MSNSIIITFKRENIIIRFRGSFSPPISSMNPSMNGSPSFFKTVISVSKQTSPEGSVASLYHLYALPSAGQLPSEQQTLSLEDAYEGLPSISYIIPLVYIMKQEINCLRKSNLLHLFRATPWHQQERHQAVCHFFQASFVLEAVCEELGNYGDYPCISKVACCRYNWRAPCCRTRVLGSRVASIVERNPIANPSNERTELET